MNTLKIQVTSQPFFPIMALISAIMMWIFFEMPVEKQQNVPDWIYMIHDNMKLGFSFLVFMLVFFMKNYMKKATETPYGIITGFVLAPFGAFIFSCLFMITFHSILAFFEGVFIGIGLGGLSGIALEEFLRIKIFHVEHD